MDQTVLTNPMGLKQEMLASIRTRYRKGIKPEMYTIAKPNQFRDQFFTQGRVSISMVLEKTQFQEGQIMEGSILFKLDKPAKNDPIDIFLKCFLVHDVRQRVPLSKHNNQLQRNILKQVEGNIDIIKIIEGVQSVQFGYQNQQGQQILPQKLPAGQTQVFFQFQIPRNFPTSCQLLFSGLRFKFVYFIQAVVNSTIAIYRHISIFHPPEQIFDKRVYTVMDFKAVELCCLDMGLHRLQISISSTCLKQGANLSVCLQYYRVQKGQSYHIDQILLDLWLIIKFADNQITQRTPQTFKIQPVLVVSRTISTDSAKTDQGVTQLTTLLALPRGLPSSESNQIWEVSYVANVRLQEDTSLQIVDQRARNIPLIFQP